MTPQPLKTQQDLQTLARQGRSTLFPDRPKLVVGMASCGIAAGAGEIYEQLAEAIPHREGDVELTRTGCLGFCQQEPLVDIALPDGPRVVYGGVDEQRAFELLESAEAGEAPSKGALAWIDQSASELVGGQVPSEGTGPDGLQHITELPFYALQQRVALRNCGLLDPENISEYASRGGYAALAQALSELSPQDVIDRVSCSGLRGRGGAGFPTGKKWGFCRQAPGEEKYIVCNADEGDPGAFMDRSIMEGDPHSVVEGMIIGAYAIGATRGYIYVRGEYPLAVERLRRAISQARELGLLGEDILGSGFDFDLDIVRGAGAFVCGEETGLIASIEGEIGSPRQRPPYPAQSGLWGKPTNINNVETWANVPVILSRGDDWFAGIGTDKSKGTKVFSLVGKVKNTGLVEVPMGTSLRQIVHETGGGIEKDREFKAVQTGGPSGGCIPEEFLDLPVDFDKLQEAGAIMGSGGLIVMDERTCMVDLARYFLEFLVDESCGKCTPCREGVYQMHSILERITAGDGRDGDLELLESLGKYVKNSSLCQLGGTAPNPVLSTLRHFPEEYEAHIRDGKCPAGVCKALTEFVIDAEACKGCGICSKNCPSDAISGEKKEPHAIDVEQCITCGICYEECPFDAVAPK